MYRTPLKLVLVSALLLVVFCAPLVFAQVTSEGGVVPCGGTGQEPCTFADFINKGGLIDNVMDFLLFFLAIPLATISIAIAGFMLLASGDNEGRRTKAKEIIGWAVVGLALAFGAWLLINAILEGLVREGAVENPLEQTRNGVVEYSYV